MLGIACSPPTARQRCLAWRGCTCAARRDQPPMVWFGEDWVLITRTSVPDRRTFRREMTTFFRSTDELWRRDDEIHDNVLVDVSKIPSLLARNGIRAEVKASFGDESLPTGLVAVIGYRAG